MRLLSLYALVPFMAGCLISEQFEAGKTCTATSECPEYYDCVPVGEERLCELRYPPDRAINGVSFSQAVQPVFEQHCGPCHFSGSPAAGLSMAAGSSYSSLVNVKTSCNPLFVRIRPNSLPESMLYLKINDDPTKCNESEPRGKAPLRDLDPPAFDKIRLWIMQGARNN
jgi:hypothetical protein